MSLLDTHSWVWWVDDPKKLSARARQAVESADELGVCAISCWEVAMLVRKGRLALDRDPLLWVHQALALPRVFLVELSPEIAVRAASFGDDFQGDPADRMIVASAVHLQTKLITKDQRIRSYHGVETVW